MTSLQRVLTTLSHKEPDRVPLFLLVTMHGAKELGLSIKDYFSKAEHVVEGQLRLRAKYQNDLVCNFYYASAEVEAWGGSVIFSADGPPNSGAPFIQSPGEIAKLKPPKVKQTPCLVRALDSARALKRMVGDEAPVIGVVMSPFSVPVMQMGFERYIELMFERPDEFAALMKVNEAFCVEWANAQLEAGSTAIVYYDPVSSPGITPKQKYLQTGFEVAKRVISQIKGPVAIHFASERCLPISGEIPGTGAIAVGVSSLEDLAELKKAFNRKMALVGNLNGIDLPNWTPADAESAVKNAIAKAGLGGGFILSDNHGEIPFQVPDEVLTAISESVRKWGTYPLTWVKDYA
ncbi:MAG: uroporphyrinogen decarboxylase family protein [Nitrospinae bacterium]|nr:uroporphyrinogen decarboxylase family protein [Nitrospinota bacterium]